VRQQPAGTNDLLLSPCAGQQLINDLVGELAADAIRHALKSPSRERRGAGNHLYNARNPNAAWQHWGHKHVTDAYVPDAP
jgi:hypothetical protein